MPLEGLSVNRLALRCTVGLLLLWLFASQPTDAAGVNADLPSRASSGASDDLACKTAADISADLANNRITSEALVADYLARIRKLNPELHAVIGLNPTAMADATLSDERRSAGKARGPLDGVPILVKDNIDIAGLPTTAGSLALLRNIRKSNATVVSKLVGAGTVILGRANLSEWAGARFPDGWSPVEGLTRNPYALNRSACGSSSGSAVAVAAGMVAAAIGTDTDGSITCPAAMNGLVGLKPTVGLVSRKGVVPVSFTQDTAGPITHSVRDAAMLLAIMAGSDPADPATAPADAHKIDYAIALNPRALRGVRLGIARFLLKSFSARTLRVFDHALAVLRGQGAILVDVNDYDMKTIRKNKLLVILPEFKADLNRYLRESPPEVTTRTLAQLIAFNDQHPQEMLWSDQHNLVNAEHTRGLDDPSYITAHNSNLRLAGPDGIDRLLREHHVVALVSPTQDPAPVIDLVNGHSPTTDGDSTLPATATYPYITVPMGVVQGLPVGLSFIGPKWSEARLLALAYAYEQTSHAARPPTFAADVLHSLPAPLCH